ncbi:MAG TPA: cytochrome c [Bryobacteraceae bacterium]|nr:cytochrome c [Bryobacteraceae bacterium]
MRIAILLCCAGLLCGADVKTAVPWEKSTAAIGRDLFRENCAVCHDIDKDQKHSHKFGPSLMHVFQNGQMPMSHAKASRQYVTVRIKFGGALMPAFQKKLSDREIAELVDYIESK